MKIKYKIDFIRQSNQADYYAVISDDGIEMAFYHHDQAVAWCDRSGESYIDNEEDAK